MNSKKKEKQEANSDIRRLITRIRQKIKKQKEKQKNLQLEKLKNEIYKINEEKIMVKKPWVWSIKEKLFENVYREVIR